MLQSIKLVKQISLQAKPWITFRSPRRQHHCDPDIKIKIYKLKIHQIVKYLSVYVEKTLSWNEQIYNKCSILSRADEVTTKLQ